MTAALPRGLAKLETANPDLNAVYAHHQFRSLEEFRPYLQQEHPRWAEAVQQALLRVAVAGIRDPLTDAPIPPSELEVAHANLRETLSHQGVISRQRAVLLVLRQLIEQGELPAWEELRCYLSEAVTPFAQRLTREIQGCAAANTCPSPTTGCAGRCPTATCAASACRRPPSTR